ncbi:hypothetical protein [Clostridium sp. JS66]|uniref:hypothetical protein n=1 Tax=Clostridium sp. JS66 TaxID=3064705 RepID=UPI00298E49BC|nr:hypothetical protein [Clostridium sp. JS66]WPC42937.1 hypothetical protein Q6H37_05550 [Clostridium sp. JS66]
MKNRVKKALMIYTIMCCINVGVIIANIMGCKGIIISGVLFINTFLFGSIAKRLVESGDKDV